MENPDKLQSGGTLPRCAASPGYAPQPDNAATAKDIKNLGNFDYGMTRMKMKHTTERDS